MQDILDPGFAAKKLAACTLAALRIQASGAFQLGPDDNRIADEQIVDTWNRVQSVIEANMATAFARRDKLMRGKQAPRHKRTHRNAR